MVHYSQFLFDAQAFSTIDKIEKVLVQTCLKHLNYGVPWPIPDCLLPENANCPESVHALGKGWWSKSGQVKENTFPFQTGKKKPSLSKQKRKHFHFPN